MKSMLEKIDYSNPDNKHRMNTLFVELMDSTKEDNEQMYDYAKMELHEIVYGKQISDDCANEWVHSMKPVALHWTKEETTNAMRSMGYNINDTDFYVVANMMYNDYYDLVKDDDSMALKMAYDWLNDADTVDCKLYDYWKYIVKR